MIINGKELLELSPITDMFDKKVKDSKIGVSFGLGEAGYDIRIKQNIKFYKTLGESKIISIDGKTLYGNFTIASSVEYFSMPKNLVAIVHDKSTWARQGLSVFNTVIEPGWRGYLTLELVYHGNSTLQIPAGSGIAQVIFHEVKTPSAYSGKYQDQENKPVESIWEKY